MLEYMIYHSSSEKIVDISLDKHSIFIRFLNDISQMVFRENITYCFCILLKSIREAFKPFDISEILRIINKHERSYTKQKGTRVDKIRENLRRIKDDEV